MIIKIFYFVLRKLMGGFMEKLIAKIIEKVVKKLSPEFKQTINQFVLELEIKAEATDNPWDDIAVMILKVALGIE